MYITIDGPSLIVIVLIKRIRFVCIMATEDVGKGGGGGEHLTQNNETVSFKSRVCLLCTSLEAFFFHSPYAATNSYYLLPTEEYLHLDLRGKERRLWEN